MSDRKATIIRHVPFEDLGSFGPVLETHGYDIHYHEAGADNLGSLNPLGEGLFIILGGPIGAYEDDIYPFLQDEIALLEKRFAADLPTLGICLGSQLMARALGARVYPGGRKEIGWSPIRLTVAGEKSPLRHFEDIPLLHWHGDTFDLPRGAALLASTPLYENQAFSFGKHALALQFHAEVTAKGLERWFIGHACEIAATNGISVTSLRAETEKYAERLQKQAQAFLEEWLARI